MRKADEKDEEGCQMDHRRRAFRGALLLFGLAAAVARIAVIGAEPQSKVATPTGTKNGAPKTPWGEPDLNGVWTGSTLTPLERPRDLAGKERLSEEEAALI